MGTIIKSYPHLLIDDFEIEKSSGVERVTASVYKYPEPVISPSFEWESRRAYIFGTLRYIPKEKLFKAWYITNYWQYELPKGIQPKSFGGCLMYAESTDGIHWEKPDLGIVEFQNSRSNNIIKFGPIGSHSIMYREDMEDPARRYQMLYYDNQCGHTAYSPDGKHWSSLYDGNCVLHTGDVLCATWDPKKQQYIAGYKLCGTVQRKQGFAVSKDLENWEYKGLVFESDDKDPSGMQMYGFTPFSYQDMYLGFLWRYQADENKQTMDQELVYSRDGMSWHRDPSRHAIIPIGGEGKWDSHMIMGMSTDIIEYGDDIMIYYSGWNEKHWLFRETPDRRNSVGLATIKKDRWVARSCEKEGYIITKPISEKGILSINAKTSEKGIIRAIILDAENMPVPGYAEHDAISFQGDELSHIVQWQLHKTMPEDVKTFKIKFLLNNAQLFSFFIQDNPVNSSESSQVSMPLPKVVYCKLELHADNTILRVGQCTNLYVFGVKDGGTLEKINHHDIFFYIAEGNWKSKLSINPEGVVCALRNGYVSVRAVHKVEHTVSSFIQFKIARNESDLENKIFEE